ncbi:MAG: hypothetical protein RLZZ356_836 [Verrucomicrobiota bacterium]|jgi:hypothetical protein
MTTEATGPVGEVRPAAVFSFRLGRLPKAAWSAHASLMGLFRLHIWIHVSAKEEESGRSESTEPELEVRTHGLAASSLMVVGRETT